METGPLSYHYGHAVGSNNREREIVLLVTTTPR